MKRKVTEEERALFTKHVAEARLVKIATSKPKLRKAVHTGRDGLDGNTAEKLKRGQITPGARIDLHGLTEAKAHDALLAFMARAQKRGLRLVLVVTGIGNPGRAEDAEWMRVSHGVLKTMVPRWLKEKDFAALIVGSGPAHRRHGGDGALYVYLRKAS
jgi:DNA-nicking Smr family endonuclease